MNDNNISPVVGDLQWDDRLFNTIRFSMKEIKNGKRELDFRGDQEARGTEKVIRNKKRAKNSNRKTKKS